MKLEIIAGPVDPDDFSNVALMREDRVVGNLHVEAAIRYALRNFNKKRMITKSLWNEIIVYASLQRQVSKAFDEIGIKGYKGNVIVIGNIKVNGNEPHIKVTPEKLSFWNISDPLEILEKMAIFHSENI